MIKQIKLPKQVKPEQEELKKELESLNGVLFRTYYEHSRNLAFVNIPGWCDQKPFCGDIPRGWVK